MACVHTAVLAGHYHGIHSVSNAFITDIFTPFSVLISLRLGASRAVNPLPTHTDDSKRALGLRNALALENGPPRSNALPGTVTTVFPKRGSERKVGAILCARIDCDHSPRTRDAIRETPACSWHALQLSPRRGQRHSSSSKAEKGTRVSCDFRRCSRAWPFRIRRAHRPEAHLQ